MENVDLLLDQSHLCVMTRHADFELTRIQNTVDHKALVDGRADLEAMFSALLACDRPRTAKTLDLIGHSTSDCLLQLGDWVIDGTRPSVASYFRGLADNDVLSRLGIYAVRFLGCSTATTKRGRATMVALSDILGIEVYGMKNMLVASHFGPSGFVDERRYMLACSDDVRRDIDLTVEPSPEMTEPLRHPRLLDVDALPAALLGDPPSSAWPIRVAALDDAQQLLGCIRRGEGAAMAGLLATPICEIAFPSSRSGEYHRLQLMLDYTFVRVYPDGPTMPGVVYPIDSPKAVARLVAGLQLVTPSVLSV